ncbi:MAG: sulfur carrier protein ThiS [Proteobacteria bacterium]|nr:sulfur carrier protein ThiS [Pseudomonadota bacterium]MBU1710014.1 sulfur carrier protein ThiS [Pseudomonadota bacterium]
MNAITVNGERKVIPPETKLIDLIIQLELDPDTVVAELDGKILKRNDYDAITLNTGAVLELIRFVGGG